MTSENDDFDDADDDGNELEQHGLALHQLIQDYMDTHDLPDELTSLLLLDISVRMRMVAYAMATEKPSVSGLKMDLDRFRREIDESLRGAKKGADEFIAQAKVVRAEAEAEMAAEDGRDDERGLPS